MKRDITLLLIFLYLPITAQWVYQTSANENLNDVYSIDENVAVIVGDSGLILKTIDGGTTWLEKISGTSEMLGRVHFANGNIGFSIGSSGTFLKTTDGGENWLSMQEGQFSNLTGIACINENIIYLVDAYFLKKSIDGGQTFSVINDGEYLYNIQFINEMVGFAMAGDFAYKTVDGGVSWTILNNSITTSFYYQFFSPIYFVNDLFGYVMSGNELYRTMDGGATLDYVMSFSNIHIFNLYATSQNVLWTAAVPVLDFSDCYTSRVETFDDGTPP